MDIITMKSSEEKIVITGGTGFIGKHLTRELVIRGYKIFIITRTPLLNKPSKSIQYVDASLADIEDIFLNNKIFSVIHLASQYGRNRDDVSEIIDANIRYPLDILRIAVKHGCRNFINTDTYFSQRGEENSSLSNYIITKKAFKNLMLVYKNKINIINMILYHVYGEGDRSDKFATWIANEIKKKSGTIPLTSGTQKIDFIHVIDVVAAYLVVLGNIEKINGPVNIEVGCGHAITLRKFVKTIYSTLNKNKADGSVKLDFGALPQRVGEPKVSKADVVLLKNLGWLPTIDLKNGIQRLAHA